jgi:hypothetical protein
MSPPRFPSRTGVPTKPNKTESKEVEPKEAEPKEAESKEAESETTQASVVGFHSNRVDDLPQPDRYLQHSAGTSIA